MTDLDDVASVDLAIRSISYSRPSPGYFEAQKRQAVDREIANARKVDPVSGRHRVYRQTRGNRDHIGRHEMIGESAPDPVGSNLLMPSESQHAHQHHRFTAENLDHFNEGQAMVPVTDEIGTQHNHHRYSAADRDALNNGLQVQGAHDGHKAHVSANATDHLQGGIGNFESAADAVGSNLLMQHEEIATNGRHHDHAHHRYELQDKDHFGHKMELQPVVDAAGSNLFIPTEEMATLGRHHGHAHHRFAEEDKDAFHDNPKQMQRRSKQMERDIEGSKVRIGHNSTFYDDTTTAALHDSVHSPVQQLSPTRLQEHTITASPQGRVPTSQRQQPRTSQVASVNLSPTKRSDVDPTLHVVPPTVFEQHKHAALQKQLAMEKKIDAVSGYHKHIVPTSANDDHLNNVEPISDPIGSNLFNPEEEKQSNGRHHQKRHHRYSIQDRDFFGKVKEVEPPKHAHKRYDLEDKTSFGNSMVLQGSPSLKDRIPNGFKGHVPGGGVDHLQGGLGNFESNADNVGTNLFMPQEEIITAGRHHAKTHRRYQLEDKDHFGASIALEGVTDAVGTKLFIPEEELVSLGRHHGHRNANKFSDSPKRPSKTHEYQQSTTFSMQTQPGTNVTESVASATYRPTDLNARAKQPEGQSGHQFAHQFDIGTSNSRSLTTTSQVASKAVETVTPTTPSREVARNARVKADNRSTRDTRRFLHSSPFGDSSAQQPMRTSNQEQFANKHNHVQKSPATHSHRSMFQSSFSMSDGTTNGAMASQTSSSHKYTPPQSLFY
eukprot:m.197239 g.197239  ORF g.197239 m.197239 type:complete len:775 (-) comp32655_c0_seq1:543-2867(-)